MAGVAFNSRHPPDLQPDTRIIALCGITDENTDSTSSKSAKDQSSSRKQCFTNAISKAKEMLLESRSQKNKQTQSRKKGIRGWASPRESGLFFSDFYLFNYLFRGLGSISVWLTSEAPRDLVARYGTYAHGEPTSDRRIVLDKNMLAQIETEGNIRVCSRTNLLETFLRTFRSECEEAEKQNQPVLLLLFGHGDEGTYGIAIGGVGDPLDAPRLRMKDIVYALRGLKISLSILSVSYYSGGWAFIPEVNATIMSAASETGLSNAYNASLGGRHNASVYAKAVTEALIRFEGERATQYNPLSQGPLEDVFDEAVIESSKFADLSRVIYQTLLTGVDVSLDDKHQIRFTAQDDNWVTEWRARSGIPLTHYQARWDALQALEVPATGKSRGARKAGGSGIRRGWS